MRLVTTLLVAALTVSACGGSGGSPEAEGALRGERVLPPGGTAYDAVRLTWAQGGTLHYGDEDLETGVASIRDVAAASSGWFLEVADSPSLEAETEWVFFDGEETTPLGEGVDFVATSADGRRVGWIDRDGPERPGGQVARVVVVDLATGRVVLDDSSGMGGKTAGDGADVSDLYAELPPTFLGFDDTFAYWQSPSSGRLRWSERTGVQSAEREAKGAPAPVARGLPVDRYAGTAVAVDDGRVGPGIIDGMTGTLSPDGDTAATTSGLGTTVVTDARTGRRVPLDLAHPFADFGAWVGDDRIALVTMDRVAEGIDISGEDPSRGFLTTCSLRTGGCEEEPVRGTFSVVFPGDQRDFYL